MNVFSFNTYKDFLHSYIYENKQKGLISQIAGKCGCDRTYLSQVLNGKADLTPDHMIQFCDKLGLSDMESRYLLLVLLRDRSSALAARKSFQLKIDHLKKEASVLTNKILENEKPGEISEESRTLYYSHWLYAAIHILCSIPAYQTSQALSLKLQTAPEAVNRILRDLLTMDVIRKDKDKYIHQGSDLYIPQSAPQSYAHHLNWRMRAVERTMFAEDVHYTNLFSISKEDVEKLRNQILKLIDDQRKCIRASGTDVGYSFNCDFFAI